jgi:REP element-mobilizing transposase RayT
MRQTQFNFIKDYKKEFGGSLLVGKRKSKRPLTAKSPIHLVLKTDGRRLLNPKNKKIEVIIKQECMKRNIKIFDIAVNWNHLHLLIQLPHTRAYAGFIRNVTAKIILFIGIGAKGLFRLRPYTKIISWGRQFRRTYIYQKLNRVEAIGGTYAREKLQINGFVVIQI